MPAKTPAQRVRQNAWDKKNMRLLAGFRLMIDWHYFDPANNKEVKIPANTFVTQPYCNGGYRSAHFPDRELLIPRCLCRRSRTTCRAELRDDILMGKALPKSYHDAPESIQGTQNNPDLDPE